MSARTELAELEERLRADIPLARQMQVRVLAGWALLSLQTRARAIDCQVVIQESAVEYLEPVTADFQAQARTPDDAAIERCLRTLARRGRARIEVEVTVESERVPVVRMRGRYVLAT